MLTAIERGVDLSVGDGMRLGRVFSNPLDLLDQPGVVGFDQRGDRESSNAGVPVPGHKPWL